MTLNPRALAYAGAALWGGAVALVGLCHLIWPSYGQAFLDLMASIYPGYRVAATFESVLIGTGYALLDGAVGGWVLAWLYNRLAAPR